MKTWPKYKRLSSAILTAKFVNKIVGTNPNNLNPLVSQCLGKSAVLLGGDDDDVDNEYDDDYQERRGVAIIPIHGVLIDGPYYGCGVTSYDAIKQSFDRALADPNIRAIVLDCDSPGGEVQGLFALADHVYEARELKPIVSAVTGSACSACYGLCSAASRIVASQTSELGSIGVVSAHVDLSKLDSQQGIKVTYIFSGDKKVDGNPHEALSDRARNDWQAQVDKIGGMFRRMVARNRNASESAVRDTQAGTYLGDEAVPLFADEVGTLDDLCASVQNSSSVVVSARTPRSISTQKNDLLRAETDNGAWLAVHSNLKALDGCEGIVNRLRTQHTFIAAKYGGAVEPRLMNFAAARASASTTRERSISLLAAPYDGSTAQVGSFLERYEKGCFALGLSGDCRCLFSHDERYVLGRKSAGTARFWDAADGLHAQVDAPETSWADDLLVSLKRGDITQASAAFWILKHRWETSGGKEIRVIERALLVEASIVGMPAYDHTSAELADSGDANAAARARLAQLRQPAAAVGRDANWHNRARLASLRLR